MKKVGKYVHRGGFTLVELMIVLMILGITMCIAVPMLGQAGTLQVEEAANMIAADIEYARSMAISRQQWYGIALYANLEKYQLIDQNSAPIPHPVRIGKNYSIDFHDSGLGMGQVNINTVNFDGTTKLWFDSLGSPYHDKVTTANLTSGSITLTGGGKTFTINISPITGYVKIQ